MKNKIRNIIIITTSSIVIGCVMMAIFNPLRKSEEDIKKDVLKQIPIGTNMDDVINFIETHKKWQWIIESIDMESGYKTTHYGEYDYGYEVEIGFKSIKLHLGGYRNLFRTDVIAYLGFDLNSNLYDIEIKKYVDSL